MTEGELQAAIASAAVAYGWHRPESADRRAAKDAAAFGAKVELAPLPGVYMHHRFSLGSDTGWPDVFLFRRADLRLIFAELKTEKGKLSQRQGLILGALRAMEGVWGRVGGGASMSIEVFVWRPSDWLSGEIDRRLR